MAREKKPIGLRPVDEQPAPKQEVPRLGPEPQPVRLIPETEGTLLAPAARLEVPNVASAESRRTHEPGLEVLIETEEPPALATEEEWSRPEAKRGPVPWGWFALLGVALAGALVWSVTHVRKAESVVEEERRQAEELAKEAAANDLALERMIGQMEQRVKGFCEAATVDEMLPLVRQPTRVGPLMERFYAKHPLEPLGFKRVKRFQGAMLGTASDFWIFTVELNDGRSRDIFVEQEPSGRIGVDWETVVTYQPMSWDDYAQKRPLGTTMEFRVFVKMDHFFSHEFADSSRWSSFRLTASDSAETLFGYVPKGGKVESKLLSLVRRNERKRMPAILRLSLPEGIETPRGVLIEDMVSASWTYVEPPDAGS